MNNDLWIEGPDDIASAPSPKRQHKGKRTTNSARHIGCPWWWFAAIFPVVRSKKELAVALYIYRLHVVRHSRSVAISNRGLLADLGIDRHAKYRTLKRLAGAGLVTIRRDGKNSLVATIPVRRQRAK